jgi:DNA polymerase-3 subunit epsilon
MDGQNSTGGRFWNLYKMGGMAPAFASALGDPKAQQMAFIRNVMKQQRKTDLFDTPLNEIEFVVFDLETTGFFINQGDEIISIGAVAVRGGEVLEEQTFHSLVNPSREIPTHIEALTGITNQEAKQAPALINVLQQFFNFVEKRVLIAHGTGHDKQFLNAALWKTSRTSLTHRVLDTIMIAKWLEPTRKNFELDELLVKYEVPIRTRHHALEDSIMTAQLWSKFVQIMIERKVVTMGELYAHLSR